MLKRLLMIALLALLGGNRSYAQTEAGKTTSDGHFFAAPGVATCCGRGEGIMQVGGGAEGTFYRGVGVSMDAGYMFPTSSAGAGILTLSGGPMYQFNRSRKTVPFITGGASLAVRSGVGGAFHFGGGAIHWFHPRWGLRFEVRDHVAAGSADSHILVFRVGLARR